MLHLLSGILSLAIVWWIGILILAAVLVVLIIIYSMMSKQRIQDNLKKVDKDQTNKKSMISVEETSKLKAALLAEKKYKGSTNSLSGKTRTLVNKYLEAWISEIPAYLTITRDQRDHKYVRFELAIKKSADPKERPDASYKYDSLKGDKKNVNDLRKFIDKYKILKGSIDVLSLVYSYVADKEKKMEVPASFENGYNIYLVENVK